MKLLNEIEKHNEVIDEMNRDIDSLLVESAPALTRLLRWWLSRKLRKKVIPGGGEAKKDAEELKNYEERLKDWQESGDKIKDIDDVVKDVKDMVGTTSSEDEELKKMLLDVAKLQKEIMDDIINKKGIDRITVGFNKPISFKLIRGKSKGKELQLKGTKTYDVFKVEEGRRYNKVYFIYKTKSQNWLKDYSIMFVMKLKSLESNKKYDGVEVKIVYMNENLIRDKVYKEVSEEFLTKRAMVEIKGNK